MAEDVSRKNYVLVVQCDQAVRDACPGYHCEWAFGLRTGGFARYPAEQELRYASISCGGCPGTPVLRKLMNLKKALKKREQAGTEGVMVHLSTCITRSNHHGPRCPHIDSIKGQVDRAGFDCVEDSRISDLAEKRRQRGMYQD